MTAVRINASISYKNCHVVIIQIFFIFIIDNEDLDTQTPTLYDIVIQTNEFS